MGGAEHGTISALELPGGLKLPLVHTTVFVRFPFPAFSCFLPGPYPEHTPAMNQ